MKSDVVNAHLLLQPGLRYNQKKYRENSGFGTQKIENAGRLRIAERVATQTIMRMKQIAKTIATFWREVRMRQIVYYSVSETKSVKIPQNIKNERKVLPEKLFIGRGGIP